MRHLTFDRLGGPADFAASLRKPCDCGCGTTYAESHMFSQDALDLLFDALKAVDAGTVDGIRSRMGMEAAHDGIVVALYYAWKLGVIDGGRVTVQQ